MLFPKQPDGPMESTMVRCKECGAEVMTIGEMIERMKPFLPAKGEEDSN